MRRWSDTVGNRGRRKLNSGSGPCQDLALCFCHPLQRLLLLTGAGWTPRAGEVMSSV